MSLLVLEGKHGMARVYKSGSAIEVNQAETIQLLSSLPSNSL